MTENQTNPFQESFKNQNVNLGYPQPMTPLNSEGQARPTGMPSLENENNNQFQNQNLESEKLGEDKTQALSKTFYTPTQKTNSPNLNENMGEPEYAIVSGVSTKAVFAISICCFIFGIIMGMIFFSGQTVQKIEGLQGVVRNLDLAGQQLPRCGRAEKGRACILYFVNHTPYDRTADSFFDEAVRMTEIAKYSIAMVNPQYAKTLIRPGFIAEIKIPAQN